MSIQTTRHAGENFRSTGPFRPGSGFYSLSSKINISRTFSFFLKLEYLEHSEYDERRVLTDLIINF